MTKLIYKIYTLIKYYPRGKIRRIFRNTEVPEIETDSIKYKNIIFCPFNPHQLNIVREGIWAHACRIRGANTKMLTYDINLPAIDFLPPGTKKDLKVSYWIVNRLFKIMGLTPILLSDYIETDSGAANACKTLTPDEIVSLTHNGISIGDLIIASTIRYFYCNGPEWSNPNFLEKAREFAETAIILTDIFEKVIDAQKPEKIVSSHGIYVSWGTLYRVARKKNIPVDIYGGSYRKNTVRFNHNTPNAPFPEGEWAYFKDRNLKPDELKKVDDYILTRDTQSEDSISLFSEKDNLPENLKDFLDKAGESNGKISCLFTNISWDGYMYKKDDTTFSNMIEWVNANIDFFASRKNSFLIVKAHPAERHYNVPVKYRIRSIIGDNLPDNIFFIDENANVKPFNLYGLIDIGLVYTSTVSLEMALKGIQVLTAGVGGHYSNRGFTIDPTTQKDYFKILDELLQGTYSFIPSIKRAKNYLYFRFFAEALRNDLLNVENYKIKEFYFNSINDLFPGKNKVLDIICNGILNDTKFIN